ncbi:MAG: type II secretion system minor pseudopilin GspK [Pseudomonadota bacterium]
MRGRQRGAALLIVLFLVATLSLVLLSLSNLGIVVAERSAASRRFHEDYWRLHGIEQLAAAAIDEALQAEGGRLTRANPLFAQVYDLPMVGAVGRVAFTDATRCLNVNAFVVARDPDGAGETEAQSSTLAEWRVFTDALGFGGGGAENLGAAVTDWIDADNDALAGGAEDDFYAGLPTPYRTGGGPVRAVSELRAVAGFDAPIFRRLAPGLCALPDKQPTAINVNMLTEDDAPVLAAILGDGVTLTDARDVIASLPPDGLKAADAFWTLPRVADLPGASGRKARLGGRFVVTSQYLAARGVVENAGATSEITVIFRLTGARPEVVSRRIGRAL